MSRVVSWSHGHMYRDDVCFTYFGILSPEFIHIHKRTRMMHKLMRWSNVANTHHVSWSHILPSNHTTLLNGTSSKMSFMTPEKWHVRYYRVYWQLQISSTQPVQQQKKLYYINGIWLTLHRCKIQPICVMCQNMRPLLHSIGLQRPNILVSNKKVEIHSSQGTTPPP